MLVIWAAKHFLATWGMVLAIAMIVYAMFGISVSVFDIWYITAAPFMFVWPLVEPIRAQYGETAAGMVWAGAIAGIYLGLDFTLWGVIRSGRRGAAIASRTGGEQGFWLSDRIDLIVCWLVRYGISLWAIVTATALFFGFGFHMDFYAPNIKGVIFYGGLMLALPIWPLIYVALDAGLDVSDPLTRGVALSCFVIACLALDIAIKRKRRRLEAMRDRQPPAE
jgi:hypothetical protein